MYGNRERTAVLAHTATFIALITVGSWISIPFIPVPLTLQTLFVLLAGAIMKRNGAVPVLLYVLLGALNLPVFHNGLAGIGILLGPTGGYLVGFIPAAFIVGLAYTRSAAVGRILGLLAADATLLLTGMAWLAFSTGMPPATAFLVGVLPFIPGDLLKIAAVYTIARRFP
ncbi:MAG: biotin transporter BioY [Methanomicrobiales archaeon]|nr:biotin transporter BioY [Methanomicrobiales archaeon]MDI6876552.1 biotin transporter BioY [Methanomicrobiales archaeon]